MYTLIFRYNPYKNVGFYSTQICQTWYSKPLKGDSKGMSEGISTVRKDDGEHELLTSLTTLIFTGLTNDCMVEKLFK